MIVVYPGSFDPVTYGHLDIIQRASKIVDKLIVGLLKNTSKKDLFTVEERSNHLIELTRDISNVEVQYFYGLQVDFAKENHAHAIIRGLRTTTDFEFELQIALANRKMTEEIETIFISTSPQYSYLSSSIVKEIAAFGGNLDNMVPPEIKQALFSKFNQ